MSPSRKIFIGLALIFSVESFSQTGQLLSPDSIALKFIRNTSNINRELILVQTDNWLYLAGDSIWFTAYCVNAYNHKLDLQSKTIFVDLVDEQDSVKCRVLLNNGRLKTNGNILLPQNIEEGQYWLRAYTRNILKEDTNEIFVKAIYILNPRKPKPLGGAAKYSENIRMQFFPEGGHFVTDTSQTVAFLISDQDGNPVSTTGYIINKSGAVESSFRSSTRGLGKLKLFMEAGERYTAQIKNKDGQEIKFDLPQPDPNTSQLLVMHETDSSFRLKVVLGDSVYKPGLIHYIFGVQLEDPLFCISGKGQYEAEVAKKFFPPGESLLILLNQREEIVCERHVYINKPAIKVDLRPDKENYQKREKVNLDFSIADAGNHALSAIFSIAVTDDHLVKEEADDDFSFFTDSADMDLLMIMNQNGLRAGLTKQYEEDDQVAIRGRILNKKGGGINNDIVTLFGNQDGIIFAVDTTHENGRFYLAVQNYKDNSEFQLQVTNLKGRSQDPRIEIDSFQFPLVKTPVSHKKYLGFPQVAYVQTFKTQILDTFIYGKGKEWLTLVTVTAAKKKQLSYDENKRISMFSTIITPDQMEKGGLNPVGDALVTGHGTHLMLGKIVINGPSSMGGATEPLLVVDGAYIDYTSDSGGGFETSPLLKYLSHIPVGLIDFIEIVPPPQSAYYGSRGANGAIIINTRNNGGIYQNALTLPKFQAKGYQASPLYKGPDYENEFIKKSSYPDQRPTVYWSGNMITDENGKAHVEFFASDGPTTYTIKMRGVTLNGDIIAKDVRIRRN